MSNVRVENQLKVMSTKLVELSKEEGTEGVKRELRQIGKRLAEIEATMSGKSLQHTDLTIGWSIADGRLTVYPPGPVQQPNYPKRMALGFACRNAGVDYKFEGKEFDKKDERSSKFSVSATVDSIRAIEDQLKKFYPGAKLVDSAGTVIRTL